MRLRCRIACTWFFSRVRCRTMWARRATCGAAPGSRHRPATPRAGSPPPTAAPTPAASTLSVLTLASAIARVFSGFETTTRPTCALQQPAIAGVLPVASKRHLVARGRAVGELPQGLRGGRDLASLTTTAVLPDRDLGELAVHVQPDASSHPAPPSTSSGLLVGSTGGRNDNYGSALAAQPGESQGRPCTNTGSQLIERTPACPTCVCSQMPLSRTVAPYSSANREHRPADPWTAGHIHGLSYQLPTPSSR